MERDATAQASNTRVGADVGGTFTDLVTISDGRLRVDKTPSTPANPAEGVVDGVEASGVPPDSVAFFGHGTTVATNAVLEGEWADTALLTTAGFRDALEIGRQTRPDIYDFRAEKPEPVVPRDRRHEVPERLDERGSVVRELDEAAVRALGQDLAADDVESVAVSLLFAFENPTHERRVRDLLREEGVEVPISLSSTVLPEIREYERTLATALNAGLRPVVDSYVRELADRLESHGVTAPLRIVGSNGGLMAADAARERPVETLLSGPAAGVRGASYVAARADTTHADETGGYADLLTMDMGGTSCDVSLVRDGEPLVSTETEVGEYPVAVPAVDVHTVGAGGGSIAHVDDGGALRVGPASAGADPGPVCYGRGGTEPTVTDAHLLLGRIDPDAFVADALDADATAVRAAFEPLADDLGVSVREAAAGVLDVANANTERALRVVSVERGHDPREFALVAYGGAGPLHATALAERLDVPEVVVPRAAGVLSALGLLVTDVTYDYAASMVRPWAEVTTGTLAETFAEFEREARSDLEDGAEIQFERLVDLRYAGQSFELRVSVPNPATAELDAAGASTPDETTQFHETADEQSHETTDEQFHETTDEQFHETVAERFHEQHRTRYGHAEPDEPLELVTVRLRARRVVEPPPLAVEDRDGDPDAAVKTTRGVVFDGRERETRVYERETLPTESSLDGPAVIEGAESTTIVHPRQRARVDSNANLIVEIGGGE
jgi:N-methylhydantoinase A